VNARLGNGQLPAPTLSTLNPATEACLAKDTGQGRQAEQSATDETKDHTDHHTAGILDGPNLWFAPRKP
jgi:hypothetical protein